MLLIRNAKYTNTIEAWTTSTKPIGAGQLILENIALTNTPVAVKGTSGTVLAGGTTTISAWGQGNKYTPDGPQKFQGAITPARRPSGLLNGNKYWAKSKPQYESLPLSTFISARSQGAKGDGKTDDTTAVQNAINTAVSQNKILFFDHGNYKVTNTIYVPPGARMVGETFSVILASGSTWSDKTKAVPVVQIGKAGESGSVEWSDMVVSTQGATPGAKLIEYNLQSARGSGLWDVHTRIGGFAGSNLQTSQCPKFSVKTECMAAHTNVHITKSATGAYLENNWFWVRIIQIPVFFARANLLLRPPIMTSTTLQIIALKSPSSQDVECSSRALITGSGLVASNTTVCTSTNSLAPKTFLPDSSKPRHRIGNRPQMPKVNHTQLTSTPTATPTTTPLALPASVMHTDYGSWTPQASTFTVPVCTRSSRTTTYLAARPTQRTVNETARTRFSVLREARLISSSTLLARLALWTWLRLMAPAKRSGRTT